MIIHLSRARRHCAGHAPGDRRERIRACDSLT